MGLELDLASRQCRTLKKATDILDSSDAAIADYLATVQAVEFPTTGGSTIYGIIGNGWVLRNVVSTDSDPSAICVGNNTSTIYRDNNARGCPTKYTGGTNAGGNYP